MKKGVFMKRFLSVLVVVIMCLSTAACGISNYDPVGDYMSYSPSAAGVQTDFKLQELQGSKNVKPYLTIENKDGALAFADSSYIGSVELAEDTLVLHRVESSEEGAAKDISDELLNDNLVPRDVEYFIYKDYLIGKDLSMEVVSGSLPSKGFSDFSVEPSYNEVAPYCIDFFDDGSCEFEGEIFNTTVFAEGEYEIDGQFIYIVLESMEDDYDSYSGECEYILFIKDGVVYSDVYKKCKGDDTK